MTCWAGGWVSRAGTVIGFAFRGLWRIGRGRFAMATGVWWGSQKSASVHRRLIEADSRLIASLPSPDAGRGSLMTRGLHATSNQKEVSGRTALETGVVSNNISLIGN